MTPLLEAKDLHVGFALREGLFARRLLRAVDGVSLAVERGESLGLVGESGCGKTTLGRAVLGMIAPQSGSVFFDGDSVTSFSGAGLKRFRRSAQMIFQDPYASLNPRLSVGSVLKEVLLVHGLARSSVEARPRIRELLDSVGLDPRYAGRYPHEFSGGQRQRIGIARSLAVNPRLIVADEPVSALDVSVQVQILNLMKELQGRLNLAYLFIAHDLAVVRYMCSRILVMYLGRIVEAADTADLFSRPSHPYTEALMSAIPDVDGGLLARREGSKRIVLKGDVPSATNTPSGCPFHPRCPKARAICSAENPPRVEVGRGHSSACHFAGR